MALIETDKEKWQEESRTRVFRARANRVVFNALLSAGWVPLDNTVPGRMTWSHTDMDFLMVVTSSTGELVLTAEGA